MRAPDGWPESELRIHKYLEAYRFLGQKTRADYLAHHFWMVKENPLGRLDNWQAATSRSTDSKFPGYSLQELKAVATRASRVKQDIERLRSTRLVTELVMRGDVGKE